MRFIVKHTVKALKHWFDNQMSETDKVELYL
jgi:hypothetical protein